AVVSVRSEIERCLPDRGEIRFRGCGPFRFRGCGSNTNADADAIGCGRVQQTDENLTVVAFVADL
ncbi:MAG: hypothetical protein ACQETB_08075, partial [Halobacteriota archaeon]